MKEAHWGIIACLISIPALLVWSHFSSNQKENWRLSTGPALGKYAESGQSFAKLTTDDPQSEVSISHVHSSGTKENLQNLGDKSVELALVQNDVHGPTDLKTLLVLYKEYLHFFVRKESNVTNLFDLAGKRIGIGPSGGGTESIIIDILRYFSLNDSEINLVRGDYLMLDEKLEQGELDALFMISGYPNPLCQKILASGNSRLAGFDITSGQDNSESFLDGFISQHPFLEKGTIPAYTYIKGTQIPKGFPQSSIQTIAVKALLVGSKDLPRNKVRWITEFLFENRSELISKVPNLHSLRLPHESDKLQYAVHPGVHDYMQRDEPGFLEKYAEVMGFVLSVALLIWGALQSFHQRMRHKQKETFDKFYIQIGHITSAAAQPDTGIEELKDLPQKLNHIRCESLDLLTAEKLPADEGYLILLNMLNEAQQVIHDRLDEFTTK